MRKDGAAESTSPSPAMSRIASVGSPSNRTLSLVVGGSDTLVNVHSSQHLDVLSINSGTVRLTPGGNKVLSLNDLSFPTPPPVAAAVPEPASATLLVLAALVGAAAYRRRRQKMAPARHA